MWKAALAGAVALAAIGTTSVAAESLRSQSAVQSQIAQVRGMLRLTPAQERHWPPVEAALRSLARQPAESGDNGFVQRVKARAATLAVSAAAVKRVVAAARPLFRVLDEDQKQTARALASSFGVTSLASAL